MGSRERVRSSRLTWPWSVGLLLTLQAQLGPGCHLPQGIGGRADIGALVLEADTVQPQGCTKSSDITVPQESCFSLLPCHNRLGNTFWIKITGQK